VCYPELGWLTARTVRGHVQADPRQEYVTAGGRRGRARVPPHADVPCACLGAADAAAVDAMGSRIDELEKSINELVQNADEATEGGAAGAAGAAPAAPSK